MRKLFLCGLITLGIASFGRGANAQTLTITNFANPGIPGVTRIGLQGGTVVGNQRVWRYDLDASNGTTSVDLQLSFANGLNTATSNDNNDTATASIAGGGDAGEIQYVINLTDGTLTNPFTYTAGFTFTTFNPLFSIGAIGTEGHGPGLVAGDNAERVQYTAATGSFNTANFFSAGQRNTFGAPAGLPVQTGNLTPGTGPNEVMQGTVFGNATNVVGNYGVVDDSTSTSLTMRFNSITLIVVPEANSLLLTLGGLSVGVVAVARRRRK